MKKITFVIAFLLAIVSQGHAQFSESFEAATLPATWTVINGGDANTWMSIDFSASTTIAAHTGTHAAGIQYTTPTAHDDYLVTPAINVTAGVNDRLSFWGRSRDPLYPEVIDVVLSTTTPTAAAFTVMLNIDPVAPASGTAFYKYTYDLSAYVGQTVYIGFHSTTADQFFFDIDDVVSDALPFCSEPNPVTSNITVDAATFTWPAVAGSVNYEYVLDQTAGDPAVAGTSTTALTYTAGSLTAGTMYYFHIRNNCDTAGMSVWTTVAFTTAVPFTGCLNAPNFDQWPAATFTPTTCDGLTSNVIVTNGYAAEYSVVNVMAGQTYTFTSSVATDVITISTDDGATGAAYGTTPLTWVSTITGTVRFYTHLDGCGEEAVNRTRAVKCGIPACTLPVVTYAKVSNCPTATFNVTANITDLGSATSITVTDNQGSASQTVSATGMVTFGPYANGLSVIVTATNDQSATCTVASAAQTQAQCPPSNDNFADAIAVDCGSTSTGDTTFATLDEDNAPDGFGADMDAPNVWYSFTGSGTAQTVTFNLCTSLYDTSVLVYTGTSGNLTIVGGNDDDNTCGVGFTTRSRGSFLSDGTTTYYIAVEGWNVGSVGVFTMDITCTDVTPPAVANQDCASALAVNVDGVDVNSDNSFGTVNGNQTDCDLFGAIQDVWFTFVPSGTDVDVSVTPGTMTSLNYAVYSGNCLALTAVGTCYSNLTAASAESLTGLTAGNTYYIQVWSNAAEQGTFDLRLTDPLAVNDFATSSFKVYPNPVKNMLNLSAEKAITNVSVFNLLGQEVVTKAAADLSQVDMSHLASGTYMVKITSDSKVKTIKVVKE